MADFRIYAGDTSQTVYLRLRDSTTGLGKTGLVFNSAGFTCSYTLPGAARAAITLITLASASAAWSSGGFILVDDTNCKGLYRLDLPNAAVASGKFTIISIEFDGIIEESMVIPLEVPDINVLQWLGTAAATPTIAGVPEVDITHQGGGAIPAPAVTGVPDVNLTHHVDVAASVTNSELDVNVGQIIGTAPTLTTGDIDVNVATMAANSIASGTIAAAELTNIENEVWDALKSAHVVANSFGDFLDIEVSGRLASADINLTGGAVDTVTTVTTTTTNTDVTALAAVATEARLAELDAANLPTDIDAILLDTGTTLPASLPAALTKGTADSGSTTTMVDAVLTEADTDYWKGSWIRFTSGTITGQTRLITAFTPGTDTVTFAPATTQAVGTNTYEIIPAGGVDVELWLGSVVNALVAGAVDADVSAIQSAVITATSIATDAIGSAELATTAVNEIRDSIISDATTFQGADIAAILADTLSLDGTKIPDTLSLANINIQVDTALSDINLDHLVFTAVPVTLEDAVDTNSILGNLLHDSTGTGTGGGGFNRETDSLEAIRDNMQVAVDAAIDTAISELSVAAPTATPTLRTGLMLMYMTLRNQTIVQTSGTDALEIHDDGGTLIAKKLLTDATGDYTEAKMTSG